MMFSYTVIEPIHQALVTQKKHIYGIRYSISEKKIQRENHMHIKKKVVAHADCCNGTRKQRSKPFDSFMVKNRTLFSFTLT